MSVFRVLGIECDFELCRDEVEGRRSVSAMIAGARASGWLIKRDGEAYCPKHRTEAARRRERTEYRAEWDCGEVKIESALDALVRAGHFQHVAHKPDGTDVFRIDGWKRAKSE
jgi:hypothetical protein